jgi:arsenate reductase (thioredoxin)
MSATTLQDLEVDVITRNHLERALESLDEEFSGIFSRETIERFMAESLEALKDSRLNDYIPLFVHRFARERLRALGQVEGTITKEMPEVLFVCVQNAGRSQMAAALLDRHAAGRVRVRSAGSEPADRLNPAVVHAMAEIGIDLTAERPKLLREADVRDADVVITMGCGDACPVFPGITYEDWELTDPSGRSLTEVRVIRDEIDRRVRGLLDALTGQAASAARSEASGSDRTR